jgi:adenylate cyclase
MAVIQENRVHAETTHYGYRMVIEPCGQRIRVLFNGETVVDSSRALVMRETRLAHAFYFPREDVRMDLLTRTEQRTNCPFKGNASYWTLTVGRKSAENVAWSYEDAFDEAAIVKDYVAFYWSKMDCWLADDDDILEQPKADQSATANPLIDWLVREAWKANSTVEFVRALGTALTQAGFPVLSLRLLVRTMNPQLFAQFYRWQRGDDKIEENEATHAGTQSETYLNSPFALIIDGQGGVRRRLEGADPHLDFPILEDLVKQGATDYVAVPLNFSNGQINVLTLISEAPGGFSTDQLGQLYEILPNLGRLLEAHAQRISSLTLLQTYLGRNAGERVNGGLVRRGDGEELHAVIWFSDLRQSTAMADTMSREEYLAVLNQYFDCVAGAVIEHDGEVLKFIGDAVLAIFPIENSSDPHPEACGRALAAVRDAHQQIGEVNADRKADGKKALEFGTGLHRGSITYGNVGSQRRLDFTVIGPAVNETARIEDLCKALGTPILTSAAFAKAVPDELISLGDHALRGVRGRQEIFALSSP